MTTSSNNEHLSLKISRSTIFFEITLLYNILIVNIFLIIFKNINHHFFFFDKLFLTPFYRPSQWIINGYFKF